MQDLNLRPPAPKAGALPNCANPRIDGASVIHLKDVTEACPLSCNQLVKMLESEATPADAPYRQSSMGGCREGGGCTSKAI